MPEDNRFVSWRDLSEKLDDAYDAIEKVDEQISGDGGLRERMARMETIVCRIEASIRMRRSTRAALIGAAGTVAGAVVTASAWLVA